MSLLCITSYLWILLIGKNLVPMAVGQPVNLPPFSLINLGEATTESAAQAATTASTPYGPMPFDQAGQERLIQLFNTERSQVDPPATNMNKVVWIAGLAEAVASDIESCIYQLGNAQPLPDGRWLVEMGFYNDVSVGLNDTMSDWYDFGSLYKYHQTSCSAAESVCNIYKLLTWYSMTALGCSEHYCDSLYDSYTFQTLNDKLYWKCLFRNIGYFTDPSFRPYTNGTVNDSCTQCESGSGWCENGLCNSECSIQNTSCSCTLDPLCSGNGAFNETACECNCTDNWLGNNCDQCGLTCLQANSNLNRTLCKCDCLPGFLLNQTTANCEDVDECLSSHGCEHTCENTEGSYVCKCSAGFNLEDDARSCTSNSTTSSLPDGTTTELSATTGRMTTNSSLVCGMEVICNDCGVLDPETCECHCASGYKGHECGDQCSVTDAACWLGYTKPPQSIDADFCPVFCSECACDPSEDNCENNGTYSKVSGYEHKYGLCRCYCPFPWSGLTCGECNLSCYNGGTLDYVNCRCTCPGGFRPPNCLAECRPDVARWCSSGMAPFCDRVPAVRDNCPVMCGTCAL